MRLSGSGLPPNTTHLISQIFPWRMHAGKRKHVAREEMDTCDSAAFPSVMCQCYMSCTWVAWSRRDEIYTTSAPFKISVTQTVNNACVREKLRKGEVWVRLLFRCEKLLRYFFCDTRQMYTICLRLLGINLVFECECGSVHSVGIESRQDTYTHIFIYIYADSSINRSESAHHCHMKSKVFVLFYYRL